jgi:ATPase subunit of ABC transporter with duplicated ATPase domains
VARPVLTAAAGEQVIEVAGLTKAYGGQGPLFRDLNFRLERGAIVGARACPLLCVSRS